MTSDDTWEPGPDDSTDPDIDRPGTEDDAGIDRKPPAPRPSFA